MRMKIHNCHPEPPVDPPSPTAEEEARQDKVAEFKAIRDHLIEAREGLERNGFVLFVMWTDEMLMDLDHEIEGEMEP